MPKVAPNASPILPADRRDAVQLENSVRVVNRRDPVQLGNRRDLVRAGNRREATFHPIFTKIPRELHETFEWVCEAWCMNGTCIFLQRSITGLACGFLLTAAHGEKEVSPLAAELPDISGARVTIPYSELKSLLLAIESAKAKAAPEEKAPPPVKSVVRSANYTLTLGQRKSTLTAVYEIELLVDAWQAIPLLAGDAWLEGTETEGASVFWHDDNLHSEMLADYAEGRTSYRGRLHCQADEGSGLSIDLTIPPKATKLTIEGEDIHRWQLAGRHVDRLGHSGRSARTSHEPGRGGAHRNR